MAKKKTGKVSVLDMMKNDDNFILMGNTDIDVERIPTGIDSLDATLQGGLPRGHIALFSGNHGSGKTAAALRFAGEAQKFGYVVYIDLEGGLDPRKAENSGIDMDTLILIQSDSMESILDRVDALYEVGDVSAVIIDSVTALTPEAELQGDFSDATVGLQARIFGKAMRKFVHHVQSGESNLTLVLISQLREKVSRMPSYGPSTTVSGGRAANYYPSTHLRFSRKGSIKQGEDIVGQEVLVDVQKARFSRPFQKVSFDIYYDLGVSNESFVIDQAVSSGRLVKAGSWYKDSVTDASLAQGKTGLIEYFAENQEHYQEVRSSVLDVT